MGKTGVQWGCLLIFITAIILGCAGTRFTDTTLSEDFEGQTYSDVLVIGVSHNDKTRRQYEGLFVNRLQVLGAEAVGSADALPVPPDLVMKKEDILEVVRELTCDGVIITHLSNKKEEELTSIMAPADEGAWHRDYRRTHRFVHSDAYVYSETKTFLFLKTRLYDVATEKLIWSGTVKAKDVNIQDQMIGGVVETVVNELKANNLITAK